MAFFFGPKSLYDCYLLFSSSPHEKHIANNQRRNSLSEELLHESCSFRFGQKFRLSSFHLIVSRLVLIFFFFARSVKTNSSSKGPYPYPLPYRIGSIRLRSINVKALIDSFSIRIRRFNNAAFNSFVSLSISLSNLTRSLWICL